MIAIQGAKAGEKKQRQPIIQADTARSMDVVKLLYAFGEGEIVGPVDGERSVMLDGTPLLGDNGYNFSDVTWEFRPGTVDQSHIAGFPEVNNEITVDVELRSDSHWTRYVNNTELSALRIRLGWPALQSQNPMNGDVMGYTIQYAIDLSTDNGPYITALQTSISDKTTTKYTRSHRIDLPEATQGWTIRVRRLTPNANSSLIADSMRIESIAEVIDAKLRYPCTALGAITFNAATFQSIPKISVIMKGKIVKIPSNYNPESRTYAGVWDGTFKRAWTDNPAWCFYDLVLDPWYGLGDRINESMVNKWRLYQIAQYCDELVPDGKGGQEPRYTLNVYLQTKQQAYTVLSDLASVFHGMSYYDGSQIVCIADMPSDPVYSFSRANILANSIKYSGTRWEDRHTMAVVSWDNPAVNYDTEQEPVWDEQAQNDYGFEELEVGAWGCTSQGQAQRYGKWALMSEQLETRQVTFRTGLEGFIPSPGEIIKLSDSLLSGAENGGRIAKVINREITLDRVINAKVNDRLTVNLPSGKTETRVIQSVTTSLEELAAQTVERSVITLQSNFSETPQINAIWVLDSDELPTMLFRVISITRPDNGVFEIDAIQHVPDKYDYIDLGTRIDLPPISIVPPSIQSPPAQVYISENSTIDQGIASTAMTISWESAPNAIAYDVEWRRDSLPWVKVPTTGSQSVDIDGVYKGNYLARVRAVNSMGVSSLPTTSVLTTINGKTTPPPAPTVLRASPLVFGIYLSWGFPVDSDHTARTEIEYSETGDGQNIQHLGDYAYPQNNHTMMGLTAGKNLWFRARLVDRSGNVGAWTSWVRGYASTNSGDILEYIKGQITETQLAQSLLKKIEDGGSDDVFMEKVNNALQTSLMFKAQKTVNDQTYIAGMGFGVEVNEEGAVISQFLVAASTFAIIDPNTEDQVAPFIAKDGQVFIDSAVIGDSTITMAKIAGSLQSDNHVPERLGWQLDRNGNLEFNGNVEGGGRLSINNEKVCVFDENNVLRVELGINLS